MLNNFFEHLKLAKILTCFHIEAINKVLHTGDSILYSNDM